MDSWDKHMYQMPHEPLLFSAEKGTLELFEVEDVTAASYANASIQVDAVIGPRLQYLKPGQVIDIIFQNAPDTGNEGGFFGAVHPNHIHGHYFWVLGSGDGAFVPPTPGQEIESKFFSLLNFEDPPLRDNIPVAPNSWAAVRLEASNNGIWLFHCHSETHMVFGMATVFIIGESNELPEIPDDFLRCGAPDASGEKEEEVGNAATENNIPGDGARGFELLCIWSMAIAFSMLAVLV
mmetsp:Transcript_29132/g.48486  ORF Transcript_29132/g.48486 Transcript_29132/m.48486 type:complete len:236 (-) Transcript_29132:358-1065(-)